MIRTLLSFLLLAAFLSCNDKSDSTDAMILEKGLDEPPEILKLFDPELGPFYHGVASGDPLSHSVIIWTRVSVGHNQEIIVDWEMATDSEMTNIVSNGQVKTSGTRDYTVKVDVGDLDPGSDYYYRFIYDGKKSIIGHTRTSGSDSQGRINLAFASCSNYEWGYFNNYRLMSFDKSLDAVVHLGDYIYEYAPGEYGDTTLGRINYPPLEIKTLSDYRYRYSQYRTDADLMAAHQQHAFIAIWDDHESANNSYREGAQNHNEGEGEWSQRMAWAKQAYYEWMPIRETEELYRRFEFGSLASLLMLDTRITGRTEQVEDMASANFRDPDRHIIGNQQFDWLCNGLSDDHTWKIIGNQVPFGPMINDLKKGIGRYMDGWDGYPVERKKLVDYIKEKKLDNIIFLTGDYHSSFAFETDMDGTEEVDDNIAVEFVAQSINSANTNEYYEMDSVKYFESRYKDFNPHLKYVNLRDHGYIKLKITPESCQADFLYSETVKRPSVGQRIGKSFRINSGKAELSEI
ncbi:MAG: alkaline phosphatase D family protein [Bacteroidia bacterium]|nr:alkaline phosphatase D family protein [Bacteroidia bacterium]